VKSKSVHHAWSAVELLDLASTGLARTYEPDVENRLQNETGANINNREGSPTAMNATRALSSIVKQNFQNFGGQESAATTFFVFT
jgi:hypothetical protein